MGPCKGLSGRVAFVWTDCGIDLQPDAMVSVQMYEVISLQQLVSEPVEQQNVTSAQHAFHKHPPCTASSLFNPNIDDFVRHGPALKENTSFCIARKCS